MALPFSVPILNCITLGHSPLDFYMMRTKAWEENVGGVENPRNSKLLRNYSQICLLQKGQSY